MNPSQICWEFKTVSLQVFQQLSNMTNRFDIDRYVPTNCVLHKNMSSASENQSKYG
jgi:hypothetical protein